MLRERRRRCHVWASFSQFFSVKPRVFYTLAERELNKLSFKAILTSLTQFVRKLWLNLSTHPHRRRRLLAGHDLVHPYGWLRTLFLYKNLIDFNKYSGSQCKRFARWSLLRWIHTYRWILFVRPYFSSHADSLKSVRLLIVKVLFISWLLEQSEKLRL